MNILRSLDDSSAVPSNGECGPQGQLWCRHIWRISLSSFRNSSQCVDTLSNRRGQLALSYCAQKHFHASTERMKQPLQQHQHNRTEQAAQIWDGRVSGDDRVLGPNEKKKKKGSSTKAKQTPHARKPCLMLLFMANYPMLSPLKLNSLRNTAVYRSESHTNEIGQPHHLMLVKDPGMVDAKIRGS